MSDSETYYRISQWESIMGYTKSCESCGDKIQAAALYCPWCGTKQEQAYERLEDIRSK